VRKSAPLAFSHLGGGQYGTKIIGRVAGLAQGEIAVHEIEISAERSVEEGGSVRRCFAAPNEGRDRPPA